MYGNHCKFRDGVKPCEFDRRNKETKARRKRAKRKMEAFDKRSRKKEFNS